MGVNSSKRPPPRKTYLNQNNQTAQIEDVKETAPTLTDTQKGLLKKTWSFVQSDIERVGVVMFMQLFETHPETQGVFAPFNGLSKEDLKHSKQLRSHALRVMGTVDKALSRLDEPEKLGTMLTELGRKHVLYNAKVDYIDLVGPQFMFAIEPVLAKEDLWTGDVEQAWSDLFRVVGHVMKQAMML